MIKKLGKSRISFYFKAKNFDEVIKNFFLDGNDVNDQFNQSLNKFSKIKLYKPSDEIKINIDDFRESLKNSVKNGYKTLPKDNNKLTLANALGLSSQKKGKRGTDASRDQFHYFSLLFTYFDISFLKDNIAIETESMQKKMRDRRDALDDLKNLYEMHIVSQNTSEYKNKKEEINKKFNNKDDPYKRALESLIDLSIKDKLINKISESKEKDSIIKLTSLNSYNFFEDDVKFYSCTFWLENVHDYHNEIIVNFLCDQFDLDLTMIGIYNEYQNNVTLLSDSEFQTLLSLNKSISYDQNLFKPEYKEKNFQYYISYEKNIALEYKSMTSNFKNTVLSKIEEFALAIAYKEYYETKLEGLLEVDISPNNYHELVEKASNFAKFQAKYNFKNPTKLKAYEAFYECLNIGMYQEEIENKLDGIIKFIGLEYDRKETIISKYENMIKEEEKVFLEKENEKTNEILENIKKIEEWRTEIWTYIIGAIATIFTVAGGIGGWEKILEFPTVSLMSFGLSVVIVGGGFIYNHCSIKKKINKAHRSGNIDLKTIQKNKTNEIDDLKNKFKNELENKGVK